MGKGAPPKPTPARFAIADNLKRWMAEYRPHPDAKRGISSRDLEALIGKDEKGKPILSYKTIDRMLDAYAEGGPNLDSLDVIAHFFDVDTFTLLLRRQILSGQESRPQETPTALAGPRKKSTGR